ncbi:YncE family protein [Mycolicibacterium sp. CBM1]
MLASFAPRADAQPTQAAVVWAALAWVRRQISGPFYNRTPRVSPLEIGENADGNVIGTIGAVDPDGDPLQYHLVKGPEFGAVQISANGTYVYTPGTDLAAAGGQDSFVVEVRDVGVRLLSNPGVVSVPVSVTVGAGDALGIGGTPFGIAISPDGKRAYVTDVSNNRIAVVDIARNAVTASIAVGKAPYGIAIASDGRGYVVNSDDGTISVIDTTTNAVLGVPVRIGNSPTGIAINQAGTRVYVANSGDDTVSVINTATYAVTTVQVGNGPFGVAVSGDNIFVTNEFDDTVSVIDAKTNTVKATVQVGNAPTGIAVGGDRVVVTNTGSSALAGDGTVSIIDANTLTVIGSEIAVGGAPAGVVVDADGARAYVTDLDTDDVLVIDLATGQRVGDPLTGSDGGVGVAIGVDGQLYVAGSMSGAVGSVVLDRPAIAAPPTTPGPLSAFAAPTAAAQALGAVASAVPGKSGYTWGYDVYNLTRHQLTLVEFTSSDRPQGAPYEGAPLAPGASQHFEIPRSLFGSYTVRAVYRDDVTGETWTVQFRNGLLIQHLVSTKHAGGTGTADPDPEKWYWTNGSEISILEKAGTNITIGTDAADRNDLLNSLCNGGNAQCEFRTKGKASAGMSAYSVPRTVDDTTAALNNATPTPTTLSIKVARSQGTKISAEVSTKLSIGVKDKWGLELASKIGGEMSRNDTTEKTITTTVPAWTKTQILVSEPVWQITGDLVIHMGNSTITMTDVTVEVPRKGEIVDTVRSSPCEFCSPPQPASPTSLSALESSATPAIRRDDLAV